MAASPVPFADEDGDLLGQIADEVRSTLCEHRMLEGVRRLGVAMSGGADSLALLHLLTARELKDMLDGIELFPLYVSQYDETNDEVLSAFIAERYGMDLTVVRKPTQVIADRQIARGKAPCRACAPRRSKAIGALSATLSLDSVAFGHHLTDAAATLLLNIFHEGQARPMLPVVMRGRGARSYRVIRPLYYTAESSIKRISPVPPEGLFNCGSCVLYADERERNRQFVEQTFARHWQTHEFARNVLKSLTADHT